MVLEKTLERHLDCKEIQPVHSEGDEPFSTSAGDSDFTLESFNRAGLDSGTPGTAEGGPFRD